MWLFALLLAKYLKPKKREKYRAQSSLNNLLNLGYEVLKGEVYKAVLAAHLDPYLGYLHSIQFSKPSLVCDIQEMFRSLIEDFLVKYHQNLEPESFDQKNNRAFLKDEEKLKRLKNFAIFRRGERSGEWGGVNTHVHEFT